MAGTTITFNNTTEKETLRVAFDNDGLQINTSKDTNNHVLVGRDNDRQAYTLLKSKQFAQQFNNLGDGRSTRYVLASALPPQFQPTKRDNF